MQRMINVNGRFSIFEHVLRHVKIECIGQPLLIILIARIILLGGLYAITSFRDAMGNIAIGLAVPPTINNYWHWKVN